MPPDLSQEIKWFAHKSLAMSSVPSIMVDTIIITRHY